MAARIRIPTQLRSLTGGGSEVNADGSTIGDLLDDLDGRFPGLEERLLQDGELRRFVNIYLEDEDVRFLDGLKTDVPDGACVSIIPAVSGG
jgi:sulfur-carrier protein